MNKTGLMISMMVFCFFVVMNNNAWAWSVDVENVWWWKGQVKMCTEKLIGSDDCETKDIAGGETISFHTGARCPKSMSGKFTNHYTNNTIVQLALQPVSIDSGNNISDLSDGKMACRNTAWKICRKRGTEGDYSNLKDFDFGFCKR